MARIPNDWAECEFYRGWTIATKHYGKDMFYKAFRAGVQSASYRTLTDVHIAVDLTEGN